MLREIVMVPARGEKTWKPLFYRVYKSNGFLYFLSLPSTDPLINLACRKPPAFSDHDLGSFVFGTSCSRQTTCQEDPIMRNEQKNCLWILPQTNPLKGWLDGFIKPIPMSIIQFVNWKHRSRMDNGKSLWSHQLAISWGAKLCISVVKGMRTTVVLIGCSFLGGPQNITWPKRGTFLMSQGCVGDALCKSCSMLLMWAPPKKKQQTQLITDQSNGSKGRHGSDYSRISFITGRC